MQVPATDAAPAPRFPMFVSLSGVPAVVIGGGMVAARRARVLLEFGARVTVIAPRLCPEIESLPMRLLRRPYAAGDCTEFALALAATDSRQVNHAVFLEARQAGIPVNVADAPGECDFYFPAIVRQDNLVIGITASGTGHRLVRETAAALRENLQCFVPRKEQTDGET